MANAWLTLRENPLYRRDSFATGLTKAGYTVRLGYPNQPTPDDVLVIWNRYGPANTCAERFEAAGNPVIVAENGYMGRDWLGKHWYAMSLRRHNGGGTWPHSALGAQNSGAPPERWASFGASMKPWRERGEHILVLPQRGIGVPPVAQSPDWVRKLQIKTDREVRIRPHPGEKDCKPLEQDLENCHAVITWASGGGIKALFNGVPVFHGYEDWIGKLAAKPYPNDIETPFTGDRLPMFERLAWAMWNTDEIASGKTFDLLLRRA